MPAQPRRSLRLDQETWDALDRLAAEHGVPWTAVAKAAVARGLHRLPAKAIVVAAETTQAGNPLMGTPEFQTAAQKKLSRKSRKKS